MANINRPLKACDLQDIVSRICDMFKIDNLHPDQFNALLNFLRGQDVFVSKPTGSGKSIIYQIAPFVEMALAGAGRLAQASVWRTTAILIIICPLTSLMKDQVNQLQKLNVSAAYVNSDQPESILTNVEQGKYNLVFMSPESTLDNDRWRSMITNSVYSKCLMGIAVDEVHCVTHWGLSNNNRDWSVFRK